VSSESNAQETPDPVDLSDESPNSESRRTEALRLAVESARLCAHTHCHQIVALDVRGLSSITDYFVIATGTSPRQMRTVCDELVELAERLGYKCHTRSGYEGETWIAVDLIDVVVHIFSQDARFYYELDNLWAEGKRIDWQTAPHGEAVSAQSATAGA